MPIDGIKDTLAALKSNLAPGVVVTDTATTKTPILEWAKDLPEGVHFVGGDPILQPGRRTGKIGIEGADAELFKDATYCLIPSKDAGASAIDTLSSFASMLGAKPYFIDAAEHDGLMTGVEHLPAALALALLAATVRSRGWREMSKLAGESFRATTGLAPQDAATAREQFFAHRVDLIRWIDDVTAELGHIRGMLEREDSAAIESLVAPLAAERDKWLAGKSGDEESSGDVQAVRFNPAHLLIGGLAERTPRKKN
jgi:prephenate dehydrogenase